jgi:hypothetical protein
MEKTKYQCFRSSSLIYFAYKGSFWLPRSDSAKHYLEVGKILLKTTNRLPQIDRVVPCRITVYLGGYSGDSILIYQLKLCRSATGRQISLNDQIQYLMEEHLFEKG